jgi:hypothetical protein
MYRSTQSLSVLIVVALIACLTGCGSSDSSAGRSGPGGSTGALTPEQAVREYVEAINAHNGKVVCSLLLDSAGYQFRIPNWGECPKFVSAYIGYAEDDPSDSFHRARILSLQPGKTRGDLASMKAKLEIERDDGRVRETLDDVIWMLEREGRWRIAKASALLYAAFGAYQVPDDLLEAPNVAEQEQRYEHELADERAEETAEQATFTEPDDIVLRCGGAESTYEDASGDLHIEGGRELTPQESSRYATADIRHVAVDVKGDMICARFTLAEEKVEELLIIRFDIYSPEKSPSSAAPAMELLLEVQADGRGRLAYEDIHADEDEYGRHPIVAVPGEVAHDGNTFSLRANRTDLLRAMRDRELPPWSGFLWGGLTMDVVRIDGERRAISDDVHGYLDMISHPGGRVFRSDERLHHDLPTS